MFREEGLRSEGTDSSGHRLIYSHSKTHNVQEPNLQPPGTHTHTQTNTHIHTHTPYCVLSLCLVLKSPGNAPPLKLLRSLSMPSSVSPAPGLEPLWPLWIQLELRHRNLRVFLSLWACKTFCLYYNAPQNGLLAVIGFLANLQITNKINSVCTHPRHRRLCWMYQQSDAKTQWWRRFKNKTASWFNSLYSPLSQFDMGLWENTLFNKPFSLCFCAFCLSATWLGFILHRQLQECSLVGYLTVQTSRWYNTVWWSKK